MKYLLCCLLVAVTLCGFSTKFASDMAYFSDAAYSSVASINSWNCGVCGRFKFTDVKAFFNNTWDMQGYVGYSVSHGAIIVAFRGSSDVKNWIDDFDASQLAYPKCAGCAVHKGFYTGYMTVSGSVKGQIQLVAAKYRNAPIYVTGHSLGGALSIVAALDIHAAFNNVEKVYTYGQPRVGNTAFANYFNQQIGDAFRVIHYADIVPHLPPMAMKFTHHSYQVWYQEDMKSYKVCKAEDSSCSDSISATKLSTGDHDISNYIKIQSVLGGVRRWTEMAESVTKSLVQGVRNATTRDIAKEIVTWL